MSDTEDYDVIQYEEVMLSDYDSEDEEDPEEIKYIPESSSDNRIPNRCVSDKQINNKTTKSDKNSLVSNKFDKINIFPSKKYVRKPTRPIRLYSFTDSDLTKKIDIIDKNLVMQLLNIVKSINTQRKLKIENGTVVPNFYLMATHRDLDTSRRIGKMESTDIVNLITDIIHMIKIGKYRTVDDVDIICSTPAIFLLKYVALKNWNASMNAVYVVTSEYLLPYLCKIKAVEEEEENAKKRIFSNLISKKGVNPNPKSPTQVLSSSKKIKLNRRSPRTSAVVDDVAMKCESAVPSTSKRSNTKSDEEIVEQILSKYLENDAVKFFVAQMKVSGKTYTQYKWNYDDKLFAFNLLRKNPTEYTILFQKYNLPSDKTLEKFVQNIHNEGIGEKKKKKI